MEDYNFHVLSFVWIHFHHGENVGQSWENFSISNPNLQFWISWWTSFIIWHILIKSDHWHLILTKKSKFDFSVYSWFWSIDWKIHLSIQCFWDLLNLVIRSIWCHWVLESMLEPNLALARSKIRNCPCAVKTLKMTILPFWWSDQISWGVVVQTW